MQKCYISRVFVCSLLVASVPHTCIRYPVLVSKSKSRFTHHIHAHHTSHKQSKKKHANPSQCHTHITHILVFLRFHTFLQKESSKPIPEREDHCQSSATPQATVVASLFKAIEYEERVLIANIFKYSLLDSLYFVSSAFFIQRSTFEKCIALT
jgi:hypothetical protein